jgi:hypothetical protein
VGGACGTHGSGEKRVRSFGGKAQRKKTTSKTQDVNGIKMDLTEMGWGCVKWFHLAPYSDRWWALVNAVMNLWVFAPRSQLVYEDLCY